MNRRFENWGPTAIQAALGIVAGTAMVLFALTAVQIGLTNDRSRAVHPVAPPAASDPLALKRPEPAPQNSSGAPQGAPAETSGSVGAEVAQAGAALAGPSPAAPTPPKPVPGDDNSNNRLFAATMDGVALSPEAPGVSGDHAGIRGTNQGDAPDSDEIEEPPGHEPRPPEDPDETPGDDREPGDPDDGDAPESDESEPENDGGDTAESPDSDEPKPAPKPEEDTPDGPDEPDEPDEPSETQPDGHGGSRDSGGGEAPDGIEGQA